MRISLVGYGKSNRALLRRILKKYEIFVSDLRGFEEEEIEFFEREGVEYEFGEHTTRILDSELVVVSPGISPRTRVGEMILRSGIDFSTEVSAFFELVRPQTGKILAVTGTNGKTTTTLMVKHVLEEMGYRVFLGGNNDNPVSNMKGEYDFVVLELSSFQLYWSDRIPVDFGVLLNISHDHEDWHGSYENYVESKLKLARFSSNLLVGPSLEIDSGERFDLIPSELLPKHLRSSQNVENASATGALMERLGFDREEVLKRLESFKPPEHRMEHVGRFRGIDFFNDSKATNTHAVLKALENFEPERVVLILSGILKEEDTNSFKEEIRTVKSVVVLGERMYRDLNLEDAVLAREMDEALEIAVEIAGEGDIVLFSPGGASFDMFENYEERGRVFKEAVKRLIG